MNAQQGKTVAEWIAEFIVARGANRVYGLQGGHIQPIWDHLTQRKVRIVDVRDEGAGVHMAHCHAVLTGEAGIAFATAGPGVTNCVSAIANASLERVPVVLIGGCAPIPQDDLGPLQGIDHVSIMRPVTRSSRTLRTADNILRDLDKAWSTAIGDGNAPGPVYLEIPTDVLRKVVPSGVVLQEYLTPRQPRRIPPEAAEASRAAQLIAQSRRPLVISGRGAMGNRRELVRFLDASGALYLDTQESRGIVPGSHRSFVGAVRARAMKESDLVIASGFSTSRSAAKMRLGCMRPSFPAFDVASSFAYLVERRTCSPRRAAAHSASVDLAPGSASMIAASASPGCANSSTSPRRFSRSSSALSPMRIQRAFGSTAGEP